MQKIADTPRFWSSDLKKWNFGDAIAYFLRKRLFLDVVPFSKDPWTVGSVLFDGSSLISTGRDNSLLPSFFGDRGCEAVFWGCGLRESGGISKEFADHCAVLSVRGPLSASELCLGAEIPMGDPGFLLPALYQPVPRDAFSGKSVCVPHYHDTRSDLEIIEATGCALVLRPAVEPSLAGVETFIDAIASAEFVLCGAMHAAVTAMAYGVPFGYWESGDVDIPWKWKDIAALVNIPCEFIPRVEDSRVFYKEKIEPNIIIPSMWGLISSAPLPIRSSSLLKVLRYEMSKRDDGALYSVDRAIHELSPQDRYSDHFVDLSRRIVNDVIPTLAQERDRALREVGDKVAENERIRADYASLKTDFVNSGAKLEEKDRELIGALARAEASERNILKYQETDSSLRGELSLFRVEWAELNRRLAESSTQIVEIKAAHAEKVRELQSEVASSSLERDALHQEMQNCRSEVIAIEQRVQGELESRLRLIEELTILHEEQISEKNVQIQQADSALLARAEELAGQAEALEVTLADRDQLRADIEVARDRYIALEMHAAGLDQARHLAESRLLNVSQDLTLMRSDMAYARAERDAAVNRTGKLVRQIRANKWARSLLRLPILAKYDRRLGGHAALIEAFLAQFSDAQLGMSSEGRTERVSAYLLGVTSYIADFPLLDRNVYRALHPDVAAAKVDPFIHYLKNGYKEGRTPHPLLDYEYYTGRYPETAHYGQSIAEHFVRFGADKGYDPNSLFNTKEYFDLYPDVKASGLNPLIHYLRHPDCRPHPHFDSHFYRVGNPDVVRAGFNPLAHFLMHGKQEGRPPFANGGSEQITASSPAFQSTKPLGNVHLPLSDKGARELTGPTNRRPLIFMMDAFYPRPNQDSGSLDQVNFVRIFEYLGYDVAFTALMDFDPTSDALAPLRDLKAHCVTASEYINVEEFIALNRDRISTFFLSRFNFGGSWIERARLFCPEARIILNTVDLHHVREERQAQMTGSATDASAAKKTKEAELVAIDAADMTIVVSEVERGILNHLLPAADVRVVPLIREVRERDFPSFEARHGITFVGGFQHLPNLDAIIYFLDEIWPKILELDPTITFRVIGSHLPSTLKERTDRNVEWVGFVPELEPWLDQTRLTVAPLRYGAGAKGKVVSSLLNGVPCVATQIAAEGMGFSNEEGVITAEDAESFAQLVVTLHGAGNRWSSLSRRGFEAVRENYSLERGIDLVAQMLPRISSKTGVRH